MKILKKPKICVNTCRKCGCVMKPKLRNLKKKNGIRNAIICPICFTLNFVKFEGVVENESDS